MPTNIARLDFAERSGAAVSRDAPSMDRDGVQTSVIHRMPNDLLAKIVQAYPTRFFGLATLSPFDGMRSFRSRGACEVKRSGGSQIMSRWQSAEIRLYCICFNSLRRIRQYATDSSCERIAGWHPAPAGCPRRAYARTKKGTQARWPRRP